MRAKARPMMISSLQELAALRKTAEDELAALTAKFDDLVVKAYESGILQIPEIMAAADVPRSRIYQIVKRAVDEGRLREAHDYLASSGHAVTVSELAAHLQIASTTAHDYLKRLQRVGLARAEPDPGNENCWRPANDDPDPSVRTKKTRAAARRAVVVANAGN